MDGSESQGFPKGEGRKRTMEGVLQSWTTIRNKGILKGDKL